MVTVVLLHETTKKIYSSMLLHIILFFSVMYPSNLWICTYADLFKRMLIQNGAIIFKSRNPVDFECSILIT